MNILNSIIGILILAIMISIGYRVSQLVIEVNSPITPTTSTAQVNMPQEQPSTPSIRWNHFPLTVHIDTESIKQKPEYANDFIQALEIWQSTGTVSFFVTSSPDADITAVWVSSLKEKSTDTLGNTDIKFIDTGQFGVIENATIELLPKSDSRQLSSIDMVNLALHEIGHAIGLQHVDEDDVMNPVLVVPSKIIKQISAGNIKDLEELYKIPAKADVAIGGLNATKSSFTRFGKDYFYLNISIEIQNMGLVAAESFKIKISADNSSVNENGNFDLEAGNALNLFQGNLRIERNFTSVQVSVDPENEIDELNETNNFIDISV